MKQRKRLGFGGALAAMVASLALALAALAPAAQAQFDLRSFEVAVGDNGEASRQAGDHADLRTVITFPRKSNGDAEGNPKDIRVDVPPGFIANPTSFPECPLVDLVKDLNTGENGSACPVTSVVGHAKIEGVDFPSPIYNVQHGPNSPALFAFVAIYVPVFIEPVVRPDDYGISALSIRSSQGLPIFGADIDLWGVPADPSHDGERSLSGPTPSPLSPAPFMTNPTSCSEEPLTFTATVNSWLEPGHFSTLSTNVDPEGTPFTLGGCERLSFAPSVGVQASSPSANAPTGLETSITIPQNEAATGLATADLRKTVVTLPKGFAVNPAAAVDQSPCTEAEIGIGSNAEPTCPAASRLGSVKIHTPLLAEELEGGLYLAKQKENPFGSLLALYIAVKGPGFYLKLPGKVELDPDTGQVIASFSETPQLPFDTLKLSLRGGSNAPLRSPSTCGTYVTKVEMTSWASSVPVVLNSPTKITEGCSGGGFSPRLQAGTDKPGAGAFSPFTLRVTGQDGESNLSRIQATLPPGLLAKLAGVPLCGDALAASGNCPAGSQVGATTIAAGTGPSPVYVPEAGKAPTAVYLAGPYKGAPYSLVVKVPAQAGPFDLGTVVVRNALQVDPTTTQVTAESDPLPQILEGIPVTYRDVRVEVNRPEFTLNPTNCSQFQVTSVLTSAAGQTASPKAPFAAANCERLGFKPSLGLRLSGAPTRRGASPALTATVKPLKGDANLATASVVLPATELLEQGHIRTTCTRVQFAAGSCPKGSIYGHAKAWTPLLDKPLEGPVYLRSNGGERQLPDLVADLNGSIHVVLVGYIDSVKRGGSPRIRTRFVSVPDAPVSKFVLQMQGGKKSLLVNNTNLCKAKPHAEVVLNGQNYKEQKTQPLVSVGGCGGGKGNGKKSK